MNKVTFEYECHGIWVSWDSTRYHYNDFCLKKYFKYLVVFEKVCMTPMTLNQKYGIEICSKYSNSNSRQGVWQWQGRDTGWQRFHLELSPVFVNCENIISLHLFNSVYIFINSWLPSSAEPRLGDNCRTRSFWHRKPHHFWLVFFIGSQEPLSPSHWHLSVVRG